MILHVDLNSFYASCAVRDSGGLYTNDMCLAVAGDPNRRHGIILAATYPAKKFGIRAGMPLWQAMGRCPELVVVPPDYRGYMDTSDKFMSVICRYSPLVIRFGIDEAYLDYGGCERIFGPPMEAADRIRRDVCGEIGLTVSVGVGENMIRAKMGSDHKKPDAVTRLDDRAWKELIWPKPVEELMYIGRATGNRLRGLGISTIGALAGTSPQLLRAVFGVVGQDMWLHANGMDDRRITGIAEPQKGISHSMTLPDDLKDKNEICRALLYQTERVAGRLRETGKRARVVGVHARYSDLSGEGRQTTLNCPSDITAELYHEARMLMLGMLKDKPVRQVGMRVSGLTEEPEQLSLFDGRERDKQHAVDRAVDSIRRCYGSHAVMRAGTMRFEYDPKEDFTPFSRA